MQPAPSHIPTYRIVAKTWPGRQVRDAEESEPFDALMLARKLHRLGLLVTVFESTADGEWTAAPDLEPWSHNEPLRLRPLAP